MWWEGEQIYDEQPNYIDHLGWVSRLTHQSLRAAFSIRGNDCRLSRGASPGRSPHAQRVILMLGGLNAGINGLDGRTPARQVEPAARIAAVGHLTHAMFDAASELNLN